MSSLTAPLPASVEGGQVSPLDLFRDTHARSLTTMLLSSPLPPLKAAESPGANSRQSLLPLYLHTAEHDPEMLVPIVRWAEPPRYAGNAALIELASRLEETGRTKEALDLLKLSLFPEDTPKLTKLRFKRQEPDAFPTSEQLFLSRLRANKWLAPLAEQAEARGVLDGGNPAALMIVMAANPTVESWRKISPGFFAELRAETVINGKLAVAKMIAAEAPEAKELLALLEQETRGRRPVEKRTRGEAEAEIRKAAKTGAPVDTAWKEYYETMKDPKTRPMATRDHLCSLTFPMAMLAGDAAWNEYLALVRDAGISSSWLELAETDHVEIYPPSRLLEFARILLANLPPQDGNKLARVHKMFDRIASDPSTDPAALQFFRPWIERSSTYLTEKGYPFRKRAMDLLDGDPGAIQPVIEISRESSGLRLQWALAGHRAAEAEGILARKFPALDGRFDLDIQAGVYREKMQVFMTIPEAASTGGITIDPPPDTKFISVIVRQRQASLVRWTEPMEIGPVSKPFDISARGESVTMTRFKNQGPFSSGDAWEITLLPKQEATLATFPITGDALPDLSLWISGRYTALKWAFRDPDGNKLHGMGEVFQRPEPHSQFLWQKVVTGKGPTPPAGAEFADLILYTTPWGSDQGTITSRISGQRATVVDDTTPPFMNLLGRIPGTFDSSALDVATNQLAVSSGERGLGIFDLEKKSFSGWMPAPLMDGRPDPANGVLIGGNRLLVSTGQGMLYAVTISTGTSTQALNVADGIMLPIMARSLSPDGKLCAWALQDGGLQVAALSDGGITARRKLDMGGSRVMELRFRQNPAILEAIAENGLHILSLDGWQNAPIEKREPDLRDRWMEEQQRGQQERPYRHGSTDAYDKLNRVQYLSSTGRVDLVITPENRTIHLSPGILGVSRNGQPFYLTRSGKIYLLDSTKLQGFTPPKR